jgi:hypothetical protein
MNFPFLSNVDAGELLRSKADPELTDFVEEMMTKKLRARDVPTEGNDEPRSLDSLKGKPETKHARDDTKGEGGSLKVF